jgi:serine/threonine protein kinase
MPFFNKHRGTEQDVLEELKILAELEHDHILRYYHSWSEPSEYHKGRDRILFDQCEVSTSMTSTRGENQTQSGDSARDVSRGPGASDDIDICESSSEKETQKQSEPYEYLFIVTTLCSTKSLAGRLSPENRSEKQITRCDALHIFYQIVEGVRYLHDKMNLVNLYSYLSS